MPVTRNSNSVNLCLKKQSGIRRIFISVVGFGNTCFLLELKPALIKQTQISCPFIGPMATSERLPDFRRVVQISILLTPARRCTESRRSRLSPCLRCPCLFNNATPATPAQEAQQVYYTEAFGSSDVTGARCIVSFVHVRGASHVPHPLSEFLHPSTEQVQLRCRHVRIQNGCRRTLGNARSETPTRRRRQHLHFDVWLRRGR